MKNEDNSLIDVQEAVAIAREAAETFYADADQEGFLLEEIESYEEGENEYWRITLSFAVPKDNAEEPSGVLATLTRTGVKRKYKVFEINKRSGELKSMKIRTLNPYESIPQ